MCLSIEEKHADGVGVSVSRDRCNRFNHAAVRGLWRSGRSI